MSDWLHPDGPESVSPAELDVAIVRAFLERRYVTFGSLVHHAEVTVDRVRRALADAGLPVDVDGRPLPGHALRIVRDASITRASDLRLLREVADA